MNTATFNSVVNAQINRCLSTMTGKAKEYATADRLHNFKVAGKLQGVSAITALAGMMAKHTVSVYDMCCSDETFPVEQWNEKIGDHLNYLFLLRALVEEAAEKQNTENKQPRVAATENPVPRVALAEGDLAALFERERCDDPRD